MAYDVDLSLYKFVTSHIPEGTPIEYPSIPFKKPTKGIWVRLYVTELMANEISIGNWGKNRIRREGIITLEMFDEKGKSTKALRDFSNELREDLTNVWDNGIKIEVATVRQMGNTGTGHYEFMLEVPYRFDENIG